MTHKNASMATFFMSDDLEMKRILFFIIGVAVCTTCYADDTLVQNEIINQVATELSTNSTHLKLIVTGIDSAQKFAGLTQYLQGFTQIKSSSLQEVDGSTATYKIAIDGGVSALQQLFNGSAVLQADSNNAIDSNALTYHWISGAH